MTEIKEFIEFAKGRGYSIGEYDFTGYTECCSLDELYHDYLKELHNRVFSIERINTIDDIIIIHSEFDRCIPITYSPSQRRKIQDMLISAIKVNHKSTVGITFKCYMDGNDAIFELCDRRYTIGKRGKLKLKEKI